MKNFLLGIVFAAIALALGGCLYFRFGFADVCANVSLSWLRTSTRALPIPITSRSGSATGGALL